jgi:hypothetical protein
VARAVVLLQKVDYDGHAKSSLERDDSPLRPST